MVGHHNEDPRHSPRRRLLLPLEELETPTYQQELLFLTMKSRQLKRERAGVRKNSNVAFHLVFVSANVLLGVFFNGQQQYQFIDGTLEMTVSVPPAYWAYLIYPLVIIVTFDFFAAQTYFVFYLLVLIYYPFLFGSWSLLTTGTFTAPFQAGFGMAIACTLTIAFAIFQHYFYPKWIRSNLFQEKIGAKLFWGIYQVDHNSWTITYGKTYCKNHTCQYEGDVSPDTGLPHGFGEWIDDSSGGESIVGNWKNGMPFAPFSSIIQKSGDTFRAVALLYYHASDDTFTKNKPKPTNLQSARIGVASVECSVQGAFYKHVPSVELMFDEPMTVFNQCMDNNETDPSSKIRNSTTASEHFSTSDALQKCFPYLELAEVNENLDTSITIKSDDPRGIQVEGHIHAVKESHHSSVEDSVVVEVVRQSDKRNDDGIARHKVITSMPIASPRSPYFGSSYDREDYDSSEAPPEISERDSSDSIEDTNVVGITNKVHNHNQDNEEAAIKPRILNFGSEDSGTEVCNVKAKSTPKYKRANSNSDINFSCRLRVQGWLPVQQKDALILLPGLKNTMKMTLKCFGQFIAMTKLSESTYPIVFGWPTGTVLTYRYACTAANTKRNTQHLLQLVRGLSEAGIRRVHFLSHSLGAQALISAFTDSDEVSNCFQCCPRFRDSQDEEAESDNLMICKSIILLNPDYPLKEFVGHAFSRLRIVCDHITVVGDRNDQALYWSSFINGLCNRWGHENPVNIANETPEEEKRRSFHFELRAGKELDSLVLPQSSRRKDSKSIDVEDQSQETIDDRLLHNMPTRKSAKSMKSRKLWLDIDVIDTTNLDVNFDDVRHSGYNTNPILSKDLEDIIISGRRARNRPALLHREGNIYSYSHVPSFVTM